MDFTSKPSFGSPVGFPCLPLLRHIRIQVKDLTLEWIMQVQHGLYLDPTLPIGFQTGHPLEGPGIIGLNEVYHFLRTKTTVILTQIGCTLTVFSTDSDSES